MSNLNQCNFIGRLGRDVEVRYTQAGKAVASFSIAISEKWKDKNSGEQKEKTEWVRCVAFARLAEVCGEFLSKGSLIFVSGKMVTRQYEKDGVNHYITEINMLTMQMLSPKNDNSNQQKQQQKTDQNQNGGGYQKQDQQRTHDDGYQGQPPPDSDIPF